MCGSGMSKMCGNGNSQTERKKKKGFDGLMREERYNGEQAANLNPEGRTLQKPKSQMPKDPNDIVKGVSKDDYEIEQKSTMIQSVDGGDENEEESKPVPVEVYTPDHLGMKLSNFKVKEVSLNS